MTGWSRHAGTAVLLPEAGIDTDQLIPARFMATPRAEGYGRYLLHDARFGPEGQVLAHPLNGPQASIIVAGRNFGSGSSREAAVYALADYGVRAVLAPGFGDIFAANAVNNGLLPGVIDAATFAALSAYLAQPAPVAVDLDRLTLRFGERAAGFALDPVWRLKILNGWDDIDLTRRHAAALADFAARQRAGTPWAWPEPHMTHHA